MAQTKQELPKGAKAGLDWQERVRIRMAQLGELVRNQPSIPKTEDVANGILRFEKNIREYVNSGGERPSDQEMKSDFMDTLPQEIRENVVWRLPSDEPFSAFRDHVRASANDILFHRGKLSSPLNYVLPT